MQLPSDLYLFTSNTLRIVCISDTHGEDPSARLPPGDIFVHAGDLTDPGSLSELESAYNWISKLSYRVKVVVAGLDSAHPSYRKEAVDMFTSPAALSRGIRYIDRQTQEVAHCKVTAKSGETKTQPIRIYGNPLQPEFLDTHYAFTYPPWPSSESKEAWLDVPHSTDAAPIWVMHGPPKDRLDWIDIDNLEGCVAQAHAIAASRPLLCIFGHFHVSNNVERVEWCSNRDEVAKSKVLARPGGVPEYDFSGRGSEPPLRPGKETLFVNAAWMTGRKREVPERNEAKVIIINIPLARIQQPTSE